MWKYIGNGAYIPGVPCEDMTDEAFEACEARYDAQFDSKGSLRSCQHPADEREEGHACLLFEHVADRAAPKSALADESEEG